MHGNAQWAMWNAFMMAGTAVLYTEHHFDPDRLLRMVGDERVVSTALVGDAMARPLCRGPGRGAAGHLRHVDPGWSSAPAGPCCRPRSRPTWPRSCPG